MRSFLLFAAVVASSGCYHYSFEQRRPAPGERLVVHAERHGTWFNGFASTGRADTKRYCGHPVRTEVRVNPPDVLISILTLLIYTPHTLYVTCSASDIDAPTTVGLRANPDRAATVGGAARL